MELKNEAVTENYRERFHRLGLFDCLYKLQKKKKKDKSGKPIDFYSLGLLALLFFFENMLIRNKKSGVKELGEFYLNMNKGEMNLENLEFENIARTIVEVFRPSGGKGNFIEFYNWETRQMETIKYSYLKASKSDLKSNTQYYTLDEHGLELIFATKEYYSEFQLSIKQLLLRKQLEKGEFVGALRQIDEMRIDVEALENRIISIKHEVQRNIMSEKTYDRYKELIEDISQRLIRENEEFDELMSFVNETRETLSYEQKDKNDIKAYNYIIKIQKDLGEVHRGHRNLLKKSIELKTSTLQAAQESLYYVGVESFNFKKEMVSRLFSSPLPLKTSRTLVEPFLYLEKKEIWSPLAVFGVQRISNRECEEKTKAFLEPKAEEELEKELKIHQNQFENIIDIVIEVLKNRNEVELSEIIEFVKKGENATLIDEILFYHFFIILHQKSPFIFKGKESEAEGVLKKVTERLESEFSYMEVLEIENIISVNKRFKIKNMLIKLERVKNEL